MRKFILLNTLIFSLVACNSANKNADEKTSENAQDSITAIDSHTANIALDYFGVYEGVLPCADCEGIKTKVTLKKDTTYVLETSYLKNGKDLSPETHTGKFVWDEKGTTITLEGFKDVKYSYFVGEGQLFTLDQNGERIESGLKDHYILKQVEVY